MDISITAVTKQRQFLKTCVRLRWLLEGLHGCCDEVDTGSQPFDTLQLVFEDRPEDFLVVKGTGSGDRLFQVLVGLGISRGFAPHSDHQFLCFLADQVLRAVHQLPAGPDLREDIEARVRQWRDSLGERFHETREISP